MADQQLLDGLRILIAEDNVFAAMELEQTLKDCGCRPVGPAATVDQALRLDRAVLIANSVGCQAATELAAAYPKLVSRVVLTGPTTDPSSRPPWRAVARWLKELPMEASMFPVMLRDYWDCGPRRFVGYLAHTGRHEIQDVLPRLSMPVLVLRGERDPIVTQPWAEQVARLAPHGRLIVVPKAAHNLTFLAPSAVAALVDEWPARSAEAAPDKRAA
jgi:2-hydroxy-6-oxonona-2,4-dienedioate hydrolase